MTSLKDDQVDRRKVEAWQHVQPKRTNRGIDFLRPRLIIVANIDIQLSFSIGSNNERGSIWLVIGDR